jgi:hypothetical protein
LKPFEMGDAKPDAPTAIVDEYTIERSDGKTVLRLVSSGIPNAPEWDGFYDGTNSGWPSFFRVMRHYLEHHRGKARATIKIAGKLSGSPEEAWARLANAPAFSQVVFAKAPNMLECTVRELDDAYLAHAMMGADYVYTVLSVWGRSASEVDAIRARWQPLLESVIGIEQPNEG